MIELTFLKELIIIKQGHQKSDVYQYWYFLDYSFMFQPNVCNRCLDLLMSINLSHVVILNMKGFGYCCIISLINKIEAINLLQNADLTEKSRTSKCLKNLF